MNFLAHIYLSGKNEDIIIGNFIADSVKGKKYLNFPQDVQKGILLHRAIDFYTDTHPIVRQSTSRLFPKYRHFSGVIIDIFYDHFLASNWKQYSDIPLEKFISDFYGLLEKKHALLPKPIQRFLPYMKKENWLLSYASKEGIGDILRQMNIRTQKKGKMDMAIFDLEDHYEEFKAEFTTFFPELITFSLNRRQQI
ncbi:acyl carrier protein phosphodiesterase [Salinimicrobium soli]|uniref:acyl carrier protein phosphodiesterase n=1 Tax=Salinimicrobium soli TaxID=1254399 RepID=UPI003AAC2641